MKISAFNCELRNEDRSVEQLHRRMFALLYRGIVRQLAVGGAVILLAVPAFSATFRWASSSNRIYVDGPGAAALSDIHAALPHATLTLVDPVNKVWLSRANIIVDNGATLLLHGDGAGGDVNELLLLSDNTGGSNDVVCVDADWGTIDLNSVHVASWDDNANGPDTEYVIHDRANIIAKSRLVGTVVQESTLNVINSEVDHLGYDYREGYGLTWEIVSSVSGVRVFGTISGSYIHDCQLGVGTWSVDDVGWTNNEIAFNTLYDFDATDPGDQAVLATNNVHDNDYGATFRWSDTSQSIYVTGPGSASLSDIKAALPTVPLTLDPTNNLIWYLGANLYVVNGAHLKLYGPAIGGDVAELRLKSDTTTASNNFVQLCADPGWLDIENTKITSWNDATQGPTTITNYGRAFIHARSTLDTNGVTAHESRMDVLNSEICYLGTHNTEAYGLVWKVVDTTAAYIPHGSTNTIYDLVKVYGDILNSHLHHNFFGMYSYGHSGGHWTNNEVDHNIGYGFDPHNYSQNLDIENNLVHDNGWHGIIASIGCANGIMRSNIVWNNHKNGLMLHRLCNNWIVQGNQSFNNVDSGIAIYGSSGELISGNLCLSNADGGIRISNGASDNVVSNNIFGINGEFGIYFYQGHDKPNPGDNGRPKRNLLVNNQFPNCGPDALKIEDSDSNSFIGNTFSFAGGPTLRFVDCTASLVISNSLPSVTQAKIFGSPTNASDVTFIGEPLLKVTLDNYSSATFADPLGVIFSFDEHIPTVADTNGSFATITAALIGTTTTEVTRNLFVTPDTGGVLVNPQVWNLSGDYSKSWKAQASAGSIQVNYAVGDLLPGVIYVVSQNAVPLTVLPANTQGFINFAVIPGTAAEVAYSVAPQP